MDGRRADDQYQRQDLPPKLAHGRKDPERTYAGKQEREERRVITSPDAVVHPLAMVVAPVHTVITLHAYFSTS